MYLLHSLKVYSLFMACYASEPISLSFYTAIIILSPSQYVCQSWRLVELLQHRQHVVDYG